MNVAGQEIHLNKLHAGNEAIPIGSMIPLTGGSAAEGIEFKNGLLLAIDEINSQGGILGRPLHPIYVDTGSQSAAEVVKAAAGQACPLQRRLEGSGDGRRVIRRAVQRGEHVSAVDPAGP